MSKILFSLLVLAQLFSFSSISYAYDLAPPPAVGSAADKEDFRILHVYQDQRTSEQCRAADLQTIPSVYGMFGPSTGVLTASEISQIIAEGDQLVHKVFAIVEPYKEYYHRMRPYNVDPTLHPCIKLPGGNKAYPSGHTAAGIVLADFLAKKFPAKRMQIIEQGKQVGINRLIGRVHHPSDVAAGQSLGLQIVKGLAGIE